MAKIRKKEKSEKTLLVKFKYYYTIFLYIILSFNKWGEMNEWINEWLKLFRHFMAAGHNFIFIYLI